MIQRHAMGHAAAAVVAGHAEALMALTYRNFVGRKSRTQGGRLLE